MAKEAKYLDSFVLNTEEVMGVIEKAVEPISSGERCTLMKLQVYCGSYDEIFKQLKPCGSGALSHL